LDEEIRAMPHREMTIPKSRIEILWTGFLSLIVVVFALVALLNLANGDAFVPSILWLIIVAWIIWSGSQEAGGIRSFLIDWLASLAGRKFALSPTDNASLPCIRFGFELFGHRFFQKDIEIDRIESVEWTPGQATGMTGRDKRDWSVVLWYDHGDPEMSKKRHMLPKPDQDVYIVGPEGRREKTATLGMEFITFLREVGVTLAPGKDNNVYVREISNEKSLQ
jgi:hypothetical protein